MRKIKLIKVAPTFNHKTLVISKINQFNLGLPFIYINWFRNLDDFVFYYWLAIVIYLWKYNCSKSVNELKFQVSYEAVGISSPGTISQFHTGKLILNLFLREGQEWFTDTKRSRDSS